MVNYGCLAVIASIVADKQNQWQTPHVQQKTHFSTNYTGWNFISIPLSTTTATTTDHKFSR